MNTPKSPADIEAEKDVAAAQQIESQRPSAGDSERPGGRFEKYYEGMRAWGAVGSAVSGGVAVLALLFGLWQFHNVQEQWKTPPPQLLK
jgi:hypothetical protein